MFRRRAKRPTPTFPCPNCGEDVKRGALACRECGSDAQTGWSEDTLYDDLDLPASDEEWVWPPTQPPRRVPAWAVIVVVVLFLLAMTRL